MHRVLRACVVATIGVLLIGAAVMATRSPTTSTEVAAGRPAGTPASPPGTSAATTTTTSASSGPADPVILHDNAGQLGLVIYLAPDTPDTGSFTFSAGTVGDYKGQVALRPARRDEGDDDTGHVTVVDGTDLQARFITPAGDVQPNVAVRISGRINTAHPSGTVRIWVGPAGQPPTCGDDRDTPPHPIHTDSARDDHAGDDRDGSCRAGITRYHIRADNPSESDARRVTSQVLALFKAQDWPGLYRAVAPSVSASLPQADFVSGLTSQWPGQVRSVQPDGDGKLATQTGTSYWAQSARITVQSPTGVITTYTLTIFLTFEGGSWHLATTDTPKPV